ncbi:related to HFM1 - DNA/RNA helicase [Melanopsichium pennsylvanicum]|uniref:DNA 3'-5' helicase n=2 Tax=Melanopsichium pennsylvanicum TaxID=63383 RepID=A0AAJ4XPP7_9BASI|nr:related to HFM1-DNA/RNA helicase [Melanopsichium pennsylvanicum 4]SNX84863.1 related to HFM1 - DNA/RNA helicase [Melanopsichium pennsylvanicum]
MADAYSFDDLAQDYGLTTGGSDGVIETVTYSDVDPVEYNDQDAFTYSAEMAWNPNTLPISRSASMQQAAPLLDVADLARHFDFERAEANGLVAPSPRVPLASQASHPSPTGLDAMCDAENQPGLTRHEGQRQFHQATLRTQQQGDIFVEPEPGRKVRLKQVSALPALYRPLFTFPVFNAVQSICYPKVFESGENVVLSAPTGSGKTVVFELALLRMLAKEPESARAVYLAPTKALCSERTRDWSIRFGSVGCGVTELTGDSVYGLHVARKSRLIVTTPEKWDSLTRKWEEQSGILSTIRLMLIDEVHILNEPQRGARLEVVVTRTKNRGRNVRFVAVSATVPNLEDVGKWIGPNPSLLTAGAPKSAKATAEIFQFGDAYRPCPLQKHVYGYPKAKDEFAFQAYLNRKLLELVETHAAGRPCLIFCATRRSTVQAASTVAQACKASGQGRSSLLSGQRCLEGVNFDDEDLQSLSSCGIAFHHAGLSQNDRRNVEQAFLAEKIAVLCCTTTLATGINLPAYCVIIRGTKQYEGQWCEMSDLDLIQMMGRAGRPQFDRSGVAVIMCEDTVQAHYRDLVSGSRDIESSLAPNLIEHVNAEIGLLARTTKAQIEAWIRESFMWIRLQKNPTYYLSQEEGIGLDSFEDILKHLCTKTLDALQKASLISCAEESAEITPTEYGEIMSRFFIRHKSMLALMGIPEGANTRAILEAIAEAEEFGDQRMRQGEKGFLNGLRTHAEIRYPPRQIVRVADKVSLLLQAHLSAINMMQVSKPAAGEANPYLDVKRIIPHAVRIAKAAVDITIYRRDGKACKAALDLARSIAAGAWEGSPAMLRQIDSIGERSIKALTNAGITTWSGLANTTPHRIEMILNRNPPFGSKVVAAAQSVPRIGLEVMQRSSAPSTLTYPCEPARWGDASSSASSTTPNSFKLVLDVTVRIENRATCMLKSNTSKMALSVCILTLTSTGEYVDFRRMPIWRFDREKCFTLHLHVEDLRKRVVTYSAIDEIAGTMMQANLQPVDMANGSHRTRIARAERDREDTSECAADVSASASAGTSQRSTHHDSGVEVRTMLVRDEQDMEDESYTKRDQETTDKPRQFRFQKRSLNSGPQSTATCYRELLIAPANPPGSAQKRKAPLDLELEDDPDAPRDLLSKLDRLAAEADRIAGSSEPLVMPIRRQDELASAREARTGDSNNVASPSRPARSSIELLSRASSSLGASAGARLIRPNSASGASSSLPAEPLGLHGRPSAPSVQRPAQNRFLKRLGAPSWLDGSDATQ